MNGEYEKEDQSNEIQGRTFNFKLLIRSSFQKIEIASSSYNINIQASITMEKQDQSMNKQSPVTKYNNISYKERRSLIYKVQEMGLSVYSAAKLMDINNSTAKAIIRSYRRRGHIFHKKSERSRLYIEPVIQSKPEPQRSNAGKPPVDIRHQQIEVNSNPPIFEAMDSFSVPCFYCYVFPIIQQVRQPYTFSNLI